MIGLMAVFPSSESQMSSLSSLISSPGSHRFTCEHNSESDTTKKDHEKKLSKSTTIGFGSPSLKVTLSWDSLGCPPPRPSSSPHSPSFFSSPLPSSSQYQPLRRHLPLLGRPWFSHTPSPQPTGGVKWTQQHLSITIIITIIRCPHHLHIFLMARSNHLDLNDKFFFPPSPPIYSISRSFLTWDPSSTPFLHHLLILIFYNLQSQKPVFIFHTHARMSIVHYGPH